MKKAFDGLDDAFNIKDDIDENKSEEKIKEVEVLPDDDQKIVKQSKEEHINKDYDYTRGNLYSIIEKGQEAINGVLELAQETDSPRAYEVLGQLIKNVSDTTDKLMDLQKKIKDMEEEKKKGPTNVTNNAMFFGSTADLSKFLKQQQNNIEDK